MSVHSGPAAWWTANQNDGRYHITTKGVVQANLVYSLDAGVTQSYPGSGSTWTDLTTNSINATVSNGTFTSEYGGGLVTANTATFITIGAQAVNSKLSFTQNFTIEQVFKPSGYQANNYFSLTNQLFAKGTASTYNYATELLTDTQVTFIKRGSAEPLQYHSFTVPSMINQINVLTFVVTSNTTVTCYMNGANIGSMAITGAGIAPVANDPTYIAPDITGADETVFKGTYYSCRIYNKALSEAEVKQNFNAIRDRYGI